MNFALMPPAAQALNVETETKPALPVFKRRWWHRSDRLDARPVLWSLRNRPEEWRPSYLTVLHVPSGHEFWCTWPCNGLYRAGCSCDTRGEENHFQVFQSFWFRLAAQRFVRAYREAERPASERAAQFASHFIR